VAESGSSVRPVKYTVAPAAPNASAIPLPIPRLAPVTRAIVLDKEVIQTMIPLKKEGQREVSEIREIDQGPSSSRSIRRGQTGVPLSADVGI
jgi:hypothetical protein